MKRRSSKRHIHEDNFVAGDVRSKAVPIMHKNGEENIKKKKFNEKS